MHWEGNSNPLQCSCLENRRDREAWWAAVYGVTQSRRRLKRRSSSSSSSSMACIIVSWTGILIGSCDTISWLCFMSEIVKKINSNWKSCVRLHSNISPKETWVLWLCPCLAIRISAFQALARDYNFECSPVQFLSKGWLWQTIFIEHCLKDISPFIHQLDSLHIIHELSHRSLCNSFLLISLHWAGPTEKEISVLTEFLNYMLKEKTLIGF